MGTDQWLSDTRRVTVLAKTNLCVVIKKDIAQGLEIQKGDLVEIKIRNTGLKAPELKKPEVVA